MAFAPFLVFNTAMGLSDRLFWLVAPVALLTLGGFGYFFVKMFSSSSHAATPYARRASVVETDLVIGPRREEPVAQAEPEAEEGEESPAAPATMAMEEDPYIVIPTNKPFITRDDFGKKFQPQKKVKKPATPPPPPPSFFKTPPASSPAAATNTPAKAAAPKPRTDVFTLLDNRRILVLTDGRKITALSIVDLGDTYGIKSADRQTMMVKKDDVSRIDRP
jgi:hypothetical protein